MKTISQIYGQYCRIYDLINEVKLREAKNADPDTGGNEMLIHNWGNDESRKVIETYRNRASIAREIFERLYKISFYHTYPNHITSIAYFKLQDKKKKLIA